MSRERPPGPGVPRSPTPTRKQDCVAFLQWALPRLGLRWQGFRKVRRQVCRRVERRVSELGLDGLRGYRAHLLRHDEEWAHLDGLCRVTISRFYRDRAIFDRLANAVLPALARRAADRRQSALRVWSIGSCSGEEPYTLALIWRMRPHPAYLGLSLDLVATDVDQGVIERARRACYPFSSIRGLAPEWRHEAFERDGELYCLKPRFRIGVNFERQDVRVQDPGGCFDLVLCRNLAFTYFGPELRRRVLSRIGHRLREGGVLVLGAHERLAADSEGFEALDTHLPLYRRTGRAPAGQSE